jgi:D-specific alpha-keto acid dehydrogenase
MATRERARIEMTIYGCDVDEAVLFREKGPYFGITPVITAATVSDATIELAAGTRCISVSHKAPITDAQLAALSRVGVRYISSRSVGVDHLDVDYARSVGITVEGVGYAPDGVADYAVMLILMAVRQVKSILRRVDVHDYRLDHARARELRDLTVGVVGTGRIGSAVIDRLRGFGCGILAHDRQPKSPAEHVSLDELLRRSDIVTLHTPLDVSSRHLLNRERFEQLKPGAYLVNTARGALVDTEALLAALESGRLAGAALDVIEGEEEVFYADHRSAPLAGTALARLQALPNATITPHTAYFTDHALRDAVVNSLVNCLRFEKGLQHD